MKYLIPVDSSKVALMPIDHLEAAARRGAAVEAVVLNVQPRLNRHIARHTRRADRDALRLERSRAAMAGAIERLARAGIPHRALTEVGAPAERIAAVAEAEGVDEVLMGVGRHPRWLRWLNPSIAQGVIARTDIPVAVMAHGEESAFERYVVPAGIAGLAALLIAAD
jgi:nucleotide-binding universal stress UspA family protein